jgi:CRP-like cAMP-binding protein
VLTLIASLGYSARTAVAGAFGASDLKPTARQAAIVAQAMDVFVSYAETLAPHLAADGESQGLRDLRERVPCESQGLRDLRERVPCDSQGLLPREIKRRIAGSIEASLDLASVGGDRALIARARSALGRSSRERQNALALVEAVLPQRTSARLIGLADVIDGRAAPREAEPAPLEGWLEKCRLYDARALPSVDPMRSVLDKVLVLRNVELLQALSAEELYPVAEIALTETFAPGETIVTQGEAAEELFVVMSGECEVVRDGVVVSTMSGGQAFGELSVLDGEPRAATVRAKTAAELLRIPRLEFEALLDESPELAKGVIVALLGYIRRK